MASLIGSIVNQFRTEGEETRRLRHRDIIGLEIERDQILRRQYRDKLQETDWQVMGLTANNNFDQLLAAQHRYAYYADTEETENEYMATLTNVQPDWELETRTMCHVDGALKHVGVLLDLTLYVTYTEANVLKVSTPFCGIIGTIISEFAINAVKTIGDDYLVLITYRTIEIFRRVELGKPPVFHHIVYFTIDNIIGPQLISLSSGEKPAIAYPITAAMNQIKVLFLDDLVGHTVIEAHKESIASIALNPTASLVASTDSCGMVIKVFNTENGEIVHDFRRSLLTTAAIQSLHFNKDSTWLACSNTRKTVHIFKLKEPCVKKEEEEPKEEQPIEKLPKVEECEPKSYKGMAWNFYSRSSRVLSDVVATGSSLGIKMTKYAIKDTPCEVTLEYAFAILHVDHEFQFLGFLPPRHGNEVGFMLEEEHEIRMYSFNPLVGKKCDFRGKHDVSIKVSKPLSED